jgi:hypothetical protein
MKKEIFLEKLPVLNPGGKIKKYDWQSIIVNKTPIHFIYGDIENDIYVLFGNI